jgi:hypothetical protein
VQPPQAGNGVKIITGWCQCEMVYELQKRQKGRNVSPNMSNTLYVFGNQK